MNRQSVKFTALYAVINPSGFYKGCAKCEHFIKEVLTQYDAVLYSVRELITPMHTSIIGGAA